MYVEPPLHELHQPGDAAAWLRRAICNCCAHSAGKISSVNSNMPFRGLAKAANHIDAVGRAGTAMGRLGRTDGGDAPL